MPDPMQHAENRNWFESMLRYIPGFHGYLEKEYRRESDALARKWLSDRLEKSKSGLDDFMRACMDQGKIAELPQCERIRSRIDHLIGRFRSAPAGYSGMFDFVRVRENLLDDVYQTDVELMDQVDLLAKEMEGLAHKPDAVSSVVSDLLRKVDEVDTLFDKRGELLNGLADN